MEKNVDYPKLGDILTFKVGVDKETFGMVCIGVFGSLHSDKVTIYADFDGNEVDIWEFDISDVLTVNGKCRLNG